VLDDAVGVPMWSAGSRGLEAGIGVSWSPAARRRAGPASHGAGGRWSRPPVGEGSRLAGAAGTSPGRGVGGVVMGWRHARVSAATGPLGGRRRDLGWRWSAGTTVTARPRARLHRSVGRPPARRRRGPVLWSAGRSWSRRPEAGPARRRHRADLDRWKRTAGPAPRARRPSGERRSSSTTWRSTAGPDGRRRRGRSDPRRRPGGSRPAGARRAGPAAAASTTVVPAGRGAASRTPYDHPPLFAFATEEACRAGAGGRFGRLWRRCARRATGAVRDPAGGLGWVGQTVREAERRRLDGGSTAVRLKTRRRPGSSRPGQLPARRTARRPFGEPWPRGGLGDERPGHLGLDVCCGSGSAGVGPARG